MQEINPDSENILILAVTGVVLSGIWLAYKLNLFKFLSTIDEKKILLPSFLFLISPFLFPFIFKNNMLSETTAINFFPNGTLAAVITGTFLIINTQWITSVNNKLQLEREEQERIWQEKNKRETWSREKIYDSYKISIQILTKMIQENFKIRVLDETDDIVTINKRINLANLRWEFDAEFSIIESGYPYKDYEEFKERIKMIEEHLDGNPLIARVVVLQLMKQDTRIKV